ncbi:MAG: TonB C-terminal domain-containing protein [Myxococcota bacterium]|nr:TonB C-terminal domain-containing protein [Myxococcota bacterium]
MRGTSVVMGLVLTLVVHTAMAAVFFMSPGPKRKGMARQQGSGPVGYGRCGDRRCALPESRRRRRPVAPPRVEPLEVLEASLIPALGRAKPRPEALPRLQTYEVPEILRDGVNLEEDNAPPKKKLRKKFDPRKAKRDPESKEDLDQFLDEVDDDPRKDVTQLDKIVGHSEGEVGGVGHEVKAGHVYSRKVSRALRRVFKAPVSIDEVTLQSLVLVVKVSELGPEGEILKYVIRKKSGNGTYDEAAEAAIRRFVPSAGGTQQLPRPSPDALRHVNRFGMVIRMDGARISR